jgi:protein gp37
MAENSSIEWTTHTFNPWRGCQKVSDGCKNCYAETLSKRNPRVLGEWGPNGARSIAAKSYWQQPVKWNRAAEKAGERRRVFCASLADVFEAREELNVPRYRLFRLINETPHLDWLLLTKRPQNILVQIEQAFEDGSGTNDETQFMLGNWLAGIAPPNVWLGTSVENQQAADERIPELLKVPAVMRFLSCEPLLGPIEFSDVTRRADCVAMLGKPALTGISWVIVGGESGPNARPCDVEWIRSLVEQCRAAGVPCFVKQLGAQSTLDYYCEDDGLRGWALDGIYSLSGWDEGSGQPPTGTRVTVKLHDRKGGDMDEFPEDLRVREFPQVEVVA